MMKALLQLAAISSRIITLFASIAAEQEYGMQKFLANLTRFTVFSCLEAADPAIRLD